MEMGSRLLAMVRSGQVGRALKVYGSWQWEIYCALVRLSGRSARGWCRLGIGNACGNALLEVVVCV